jgi:hypothetical protein
MIVLAFPQESISLMAAQETRCVGKSEGICPVTYNLQDPIG